jgi:hypothetical protein
MLNRRMIVAALAAVLFCATINDDAFAVPFQPGQFITYSQDSWGATPSAGNAAQLLLGRFGFVYPVGAVEVGITGSAGFSMIFTSAPAVLDYLPSSGAPASLNSDLLDPTSSASGAFGGAVLALQLNVDFDDADELAGSVDIPFGDLILHNLTLSDFNGLTVRQFLAEVNDFLGGETPPITYDDLFFLTEDVTRAFEGGTPSQFAQDHLQAPDDVLIPVPEPSTLGLLVIGLGVLAARRFKGKGRVACQTRHPRF